MAKRDTGPVKNEQYPYPSRFATHASMVIAEKEDGTVVCKDEFGEYITSKKCVDNGQCDPNRYDSRRPGIRRWLGEAVPEDPH